MTLLKYNFLKVTYLEKIQTFENDFEESIIKIKKCQSKINEIKKIFLGNSGKFLLSKIKLNNLEIIKSILDSINSSDFLLKKLKTIEFKNNIPKQYFYLFKMKEELNKYSYYKIHREKINVVKNLNVRIDKKLQKLNISFVKSLFEFFKDKNRNYLNHIFYFYLINKQSTPTELSNEFFNLFISSFKNNLKHLIYGSFSPFLKENVFEIFQIESENLGIYNMNYKYYKISNLIEKIDFNKDIIIFLEYLLKNCINLINNLTYYIIFHERLDKIIQENINSIIVVDDKRNPKEFNIKYLKRNYILLEEVIAKHYFNSYIEELKKFSVYFVSNEKLKNLFVLKKDEFIKIIEKRIIKILNGLKNFILDLEPENFEKLIKIFFNVSQNIEFSFFNPQCDNFLENFVLKLIKENTLVKIRNSINEINLVISNDIFKRIHFDFLNFIKLLKIKLIDGKISDYISLPYRESNKYTRILNDIENKELHKNIILDFISSKQNRVFTVTSTKLLKHYFLHKNMELIYEQFTKEKGNSSSIIIQYYIISSINLYKFVNSFQDLIININIENITIDSLKTVFDKILYQKQFFLIRQFIKNFCKNLGEVYKTDSKYIENFLIMTDAEKSFINSEFTLPSINNEIYLNGNVFSGVLENFINFESMISIIEIIMEINEQLNLDNFENSLNGIILKDINFSDELKRYCLYPICSQVFDIFENIRLKIINIMWDLDETNIIFILNTTNFYVEYIFKKINELTESLINMSGGTLIKNDLKNLVQVLCLFISDKLIPIFSKIKKCSSLGRSVMIKDIRSLIELINEKYEIQSDEYFKSLILFINSWHFDEVNFLKYLEENHIQYEIIIDVLNSMKFYSRMNTHQKKEYILKINSIYLENILFIKVSMLD